MSDRRRFIWKSGRLTSTPINDGWAIDRDTRDPSIPNLPLETAAAASTSQWEQGSTRAVALSRRDSTNRRRPQVVYPFETEQAAANTDSSLGATFQTRTIRSRKALSQGWMAALTRQPTITLHIAATFGARSIRRKQTERRLQTVVPLEWKYIAPPVAAILPAPKVIKVEFRRTARVVQPLATYPATPPTGPPYPSWLAAAAFRVSHDKWLVQAPEQDSYPATPSVPVEGNSTEAPFETRRIRGRKRLTLADAPVYPQAATPFQWTPNDAPETLKRRETERRLVKAAYPPVYPQPTAPPTVEFAAVSPVRSRRRRGGGGGSIAIDVLVVGEAGSTPTPAVYPSFLPTGHNKRKGTERKAQQAPDVVGVNAATSTLSDDGVAATPFETRRIRGRKLLRTSDLVGIEPAAPVTYPGVVSAFTPVKAIRRKSLGQGFVTVDVVSGQVPATNYYPAFVPSGWFRRAELNRRHLQAIDAPSKPQTPPVPEQPPTAFRLAQAHIRGRLARKLRESDGPLHVEAAPYTPPTDESSGGWWPDYYHIHRMRDVRLRQRKERERELQQIKDATDREIAILLSEQEARDAEASDLARIQALADKYDAKSTALPKAARVAIWNAQDARTRNALEQMLRVLAQIELEEHLALIAALLLDDDD